jgi:fructose-bisphosphate aldolase, class I
MSERTFVSTLYRLNRLFHPRSGRCLDVAIDHGFFGEPSFLTGIESLPSAVTTLVEAAPDAIQLTIGQAPVLQRIPGRAKPSLVLRTDVANVYGKHLPDTLFSHMIDHPIEQAFRVDATCIVVNLFDLPDRADVREACIRNILALKPAAERSGMPLMVEPLAMAHSTAGGGYDSDLDADRVTALVRQAVELGADIIKCDPTQDPADIARVVQTAGDIPVLIRGGGKVDDLELLRRTAAVLDAGARGIVYGRNIIQHADPAGMTRALMGLLHEGLDVDSAAARIRPGAEA